MVCRDEIIGVKMTSNNNAIIDRIIAEEWEMFASVNTHEPVACQHRYKTFQLMRWMTHSIHTREFLKSYLADLTHAKATGRNLMTEKYARMERQIPPLKDRRMQALIKEITGIEANWMKELRKCYSLIFADQADSFLNYAGCELETLSDQSITLYHKEVVDALAKGRNLISERYENLAKKLGYDSLGHMDKSVAGNGRG